MLNKLILRAFLSISLMISFISASNATLLSQEILNGGNVIGSITINVDNAQEWDFEDSYVEDFVAFDLLGFNLLDFNDYGIENYFFEAHFNPENLFAGLITLDFDLNDFGFNYAWDGSIWNDPSFDYISVFAGPENIAFYSPNVSFGKVNVVPTPATLVLFLTAVFGLVARRINS
ncbi:hypothetical protein GCM10009111_00020 [Colwellia asteriadis]|uniref:PEP-CTERM protein-sorting domain-containing protein n=1 Tax=Colwellia asteriadis TaxID=517723 RepID=A0ABP3WC21_9GAMM